MECIKINTRVNKKLQYIAVMEIQQYIDDAVQCPVEFIDNV